MARQRKMTAARLGPHDVRCLRDEAQRESDSALVEACDVALSLSGAGAAGLKMRDIQRAQKVVVGEINRRAGYASAGAASETGGGSGGRTRAQIEREIEADVGSGVIVGHGRQARELGDATGPITVVVAWTEDTQEIAPGQRSWRHDLGERPKLVDIKKPHAAMWVNEGTRADADKALAYIRKEHPGSGRVFVYSLTERDPLGRARREALSARST